jgi:hypothetical protein
MLDLSHVARGGCKGMLHACNQCTHLFLLSRPMVPGRAENQTWSGSLAPVMRCRQCGGP